MHLTVILFGFIDNIVRVWGIFLFGATLFHKEIRFVDEHNNTNQQTDEDTYVLEIDWREDRWRFLERSRALHRTVVHRHIKDHELRQVTDICTVVVVGLPERQVGQVVNHEKNRKSKQNKGRKVILVSARHVETHSHAVDDGDDEVGLFKTPSLEFVFKLTETIFLGTKKGDSHQDGDDECSRCTQSS